MRINKLITNNLGLYYGKNEIDLKPKSDKPIILFGGLNGAGKTTLFESIMHCFYGKNIFENISINDYKKYLKSKIFHSDKLLIQPFNSYISIEFDYVNDGEINNYLVKRSWEIFKNDVKERLTIKKNDEYLKGIDDKYLQEFLNELIPLGVSNLFFFDGEKIQTIISNDNNSNFVDSFKKLLGINLLERLDSDIKIYREKLLKKKAVDNFKKEIEELSNEIEIINNKISKENEVSANLNNNFIKLNSDIESYRKKINSQGGSFWENKIILERDEINLNIRIKELEVELKEIAIDYLPILISNNLTKNLEKKLRDDKDNNSNVDIINFIESKKEIFFNKLPQDNIELIKNAFDNSFKLSDNNNDNIGLSKIDLENLLQDISFSRTHIDLKLKKILSDYEDSYRKLQKIDIELKKVPDEKLVKPLYETLNRLKKERNSLNEEISIIKYKIQEYEKEKNELERRKLKIEKSIALSNKNNIKISLTQKTQSVLVKYKKYLVDSKLHELESLFLDIFNNLHRKKIVNRVKIDKFNFNIELFDKSGTIINKDLLSSGEKEIYAISLLQSLAKISKLRLPFIIDTPLGRLDTVHRVNIIEKFITTASHQVIIFSTNTEIDEEYYKLLKPYISKEYLMSFDLDKKYSTIKEGYFW